MSIKFIIGYAIGVTLAYSALFGLKIISLYENDIKKFFSQKRQKVREENDNRERSTDNREND